MTVLDTFSLTGKVAVVTGGNRGLGRAFAHALGEAGASIAILARNAARNAEVLAELEAKGITAAAFEGDVARRADVERAAGEIVERFGRVDVLVNNAGTCIHRPALEVTEEEWNEVIDVNLTGVWHGCQIFGKAHGGGRWRRHRQRRLHVGGHRQPPQWQPAYNASKAGVHHLTRSLAAEWAPLGVRVNAVAPGYVVTEMTPIDRPEFKRYWIDDAPQQRGAAPDEIAPAVLFLASPASGFMTGSILTIDGGYSVF